MNFSITKIKNTISFKSPLQIVPQRRRRQAPDHTLDPSVRPLPLRHIQLQLSEADVDVRDAFLEMGNLFGEDGVGEEEFFQVFEGVFDFDDGGVEEGDVGLMGAGRCHLAPRVSEFRRVLEASAFAFIGTPAMARLPKEQRVHQLAGPCAYVCLFPPPASAAQCLVGPAHEQGVQELIKADEDVFSVGHAASTSSAVAAASTAALRSPPRCIVPFLCFMAPSA